MAMQYNMNPNRRKGADLLTGRDFNPYVKKSRTIGDIDSMREAWKSLKHGQHQV